MFAVDGRFFCVDHEAEWDRLAGETKAAREARDKLRQQQLPTGRKTRF